MGGQSSNDMTREKTYDLSALVYEMDEGQPVYFRGFKEVLSGTKTLEQVMGSSILQSIIIKLVQEFFDDHFGQTHKALSNEIGIQFKKQSWRNADIAVYSLKELSKNRKKIADKYASFPPEFVVEIDTKADFTPEAGMTEYVLHKTQQLLDFGVHQVIWIFTANEKFILARPGKRWEIGNWNEDIEIKPGLVLNITGLLADFEKKLDEL